MEFLGCHCRLVGNQIAFGSQTTTKYGSAIHLMLRKKEKNLKKVKTEPMATDCAKDTFELKSRIDLLLHDLSLYQQSSTPNPPSNSDLQAINFFKLNLEKSNKFNRLQDNQLGLTINDKVHIINQFNQLESKILDLIREYNNFSSILWTV